MPELPEVEVLVRHLRPLVCGRTIRAIQVRREKILKPTLLAQFKRTLLGARFTDLSRRGKYLCFTLQARRSRKPITLVGHLGMTGRMFIARKGTPLPKHAAVILDLGREQFVYEDTRYFGRLTLDATSISQLGPEPSSQDFSADYFSAALARSSQAIKVKLLDQSLVAGVGNIYASEALYRAKISPRLPAKKLSAAQAKKLLVAVRDVLAEAIRFGSTVPLNHGANPRGGGLFYFGLSPDALDYYEERLRVYDRAGQPCQRCNMSIKRIVQAARSTYYCPRCQS